MSTEAVRLVIWDLDDTFWKGTLSEGGIEHYVDEHHDIVVELARRGIISSICSKNDHSAVEAILRDKGLWDYIVFPSIDWSPKGERIRAIVEAVQLRPETILFIDDNHGNRAEALAAVPGLQVADCDVIAGMLRHASFAGKEDRDLQRLAQYKTLMLKQQGRQRADGDNIQFLRGSDIRVEIVTDLADKLDRVVELINRTNQLNFTRRRLAGDPDEAKAQIAAQLERFDVRAGLVSVRDRFGDYGDCGFFLLTGYWRAVRLWQFAFSCRVLGMGVEQWIYEKLGRPEITIVGEPLSKLDFVPDWINQPTAADAPTAASEASLPEVRIRGGCDLEVLEHFFRVDSNSVTLEVIKLWNLHVVFKNNSGLLVQGIGSGGAFDIASIDRLGLAEEDVRSHFFAPCQDDALLIFSPTGDAFSRIYRHRATGMLLPIFLQSFGAPTPRSSQEEQAYFEKAKLSEAQRADFARIKQELEEHYDLLPGDNAEIMEEYYRKIVEAVPDNALLMVLLPNHRMMVDGAVVANARQERFNAAFCRAAEGRGNIELVALSEVVDPARDVQDHYHHFSRTTYYRIYQLVRARYLAWRSAKGAAEI